MFSSHKNSRRGVQSKNSARLAAEVLECRAMPATFGVAWPDARNLSVSFPTDDASIGAYGNSLRELLDQVADRKVWQETVLRAFQTWAVQANINIGLTPDRGDTFGTVGLSVNDPRFGEIRIGAFPQPGVLASALPYQQTAGTWSGDVFLNTQTNWFLGDWSSGGPITVPDANAKGPAVELFSVLLHEAGNSLGVADNAVRGTVMYTDYQGPRGLLTARDINAIRSIYGVRRDVYESTSNGTRSTATPIVYRPGFTGATPHAVRGSLNSLTDADFYRFRPVTGRDQVTVRLQVAGISLLKATLEVYDNRGNKISDIKADSIFDNNLQITLSSLQQGRDYFVRVARNSSDVFAVGDYQLELDYRDPSQQPSIVPPEYDADASDEDDAAVNYVSVDQLFSTGLVSRELNTNETLATASTLETTPGYLAGTRYEVVASLGQQTDRDFYRFRTPTTASGLLNIDLNPLGSTPISPNIVVMNSNGDRVAARVLEKAGRGLSVQITNPVKNAEYIVAVLHRENSTVTSGNYALTVDLSTEAASMKELFRGNVVGGQSDFSRLETSKSQLFRFDLSATATTSNEGVQLTFFDARTRDAVFTISVGAGLTTTEYIWLAQGNYVIQAVARTRRGVTAGRVNFRLLADGISDDQGPNPIDPTIAMPPLLRPPVWIDYPPQVSPPVILPPMVIEDPWLNELMVPQFPGFYLYYFG
jgi:hypothetical protein